MTDKPSIIKIVALALPAVVLLSLNVSPVLYLVGVALGIYAAILTAEYIAEVVVNLAERRRELQAITPRIRELEILAKLPADRLEYIPPNLDHVELLQASSWTGKAWHVETALSTRDGAVPLEFVRSFLASSGVVSLLPINRFSEGTADYSHARALTEFLRQEGVAIGGDGSSAGKAARWASPAARDSTLELFEVDLGDVFNMPITNKERENAWQR